MKSALCFSLFQKYLVALSGLGLFGFVFVHMAGGLLIFAGPQAYNTYAAGLQNRFLIVFEMGLLALFLCHVVLAVFLSVKNHRARPKNRGPGGKGIKATALYQKTLVYQGGVILVFVILHLITFKFGPHYDTGGAKEASVRDLFRLVVEVFQSPFMVLWYLGALGLLGFHLFHGLQSVFWSLGWGGDSLWRGRLGRLSLAFSLFVTLGFMIQPLYAHFFLGDL